MVRSANARNSHQANGLGLVGLLPEESSEEGAD